MSKLQRIQSMTPDLLAKIIIGASKYDSSTEALKTLHWLPIHLRGGRRSPAGQPRWLSGLRRSHVHSLVIARRSLCPEKLGSNPGQGIEGINFSGWHGLDMSITVTKRR